MTLRLDHEDKSYVLSIDGTRYTITTDNPGEVVATGAATVVETRPGTYTVLFEDGASVAVDLRAGAKLVLQAGQHRFDMAVSDPRDRRAGAREASAEGPSEVRSQMPGKIIKLLVSEGQAVEAGDGLLVMEAMKMQNEAKSPKSGAVRRVAVKEGSAVAAGELLAVVE